MPQSWPDLSIFATSDWDWSPSSPSVQPDTFQFVKPLCSELPQGSPNNSPSIDGCPSSPEPAAIEEFLQYLDSMIERPPS